MIVMIKIAIDAMGGDNAPAEIVKGCIRAIKMYPDIELTLYGDESKIKPYLTNNDRISIVHTTHHIDMGEKDPIKQIRNNRNSSLVLAMQSIKNKEQDAVVTAGPTQAVVVGAHIIVRRLPQMQRIALAPIIPSIDGRGKILLDAGANLELKGDHIHELAVFASIVAKEYLGVERPRVGLLNIGTEPGKGRDVDKETYDILSRAREFDFSGNVETKEILTCDSDILVTDGFTGNMVMKTMEGVAKGTGIMLKEEVKRTFLGKIGGLLLKKNFARYKKRLDASEIGGAMLIGINAPVIKAHGSSDAYAFCNGIRQARNLVKSEVIDKVVRSLTNEAP